MKTLIYAWRFLTRAKSYTIINLLGLAFSLVHGTDKVPALRTDG